MYYVILHYQYRNQCIYVFLNNVGVHAQKFNWYDKNCVEGCINTIIS